MSKPTRIILRYDGDDSDIARQATAATRALQDGLQPGGLYGVIVGGRSYGVKRNDAGSVSVFPSEASQ